MMKFGREGDSLRVIDERAIQETKRWNNMSFTEKLGDFTARRQYSLIIGGWATSLGVAAAIISRNKYQTFPQKVHTFLIYCSVKRDDFHPLFRLYKPVCGLKV